MWNIAQLPTFLFPKGQSLAIRQWFTSPLDKLRKNSAIPHGFEAMMTGCRRFKSPRSSQIITASGFGAHHLPVVPVALGDGDRSSACDEGARGWAQPCCDLGRSPSHPVSLCKIATAHYAWAQISNLAKLLYMTMCVCVSGWCFQNLCKILIHQPFTCVCVCVWMMLSKSLKHLHAASKHQSVLFVSPIFDWSNAGFRASAQWILPMVQTCDLHQFWAVYYPKHLWTSKRVSWFSRCQDDANTNQVIWYQYPNFMMPVDLNIVRRLCRIN